MVEIITRAGWGAQPPKATPIKTVAKELYLHHSVGSGVVDKDGDGDKGDDYMRSMQLFHQNTRGWNDIAYNHAYDPDGGEFYEGRGFGITPGAQCRHNTGTHSLVVMGNFATQTVTEKMIDDIAGFYRWGWEEGLLPGVLIQGHRDAPVTGSCSGTTCPGNKLYDALPVINTRAQEDDMPTNEEIAQIVRTELDRQSDGKVSTKFGTVGIMQSVFSGKIGKTDLSMASHLELILKDTNDIQSRLEEIEAKIDALDA